MAGKLRDLRQRPRVLMGGGLVAADMASITAGQTAWGIGFTAHTPSLAAKPADLS